MITFRLNGKPIQVATSWDELTYEQYLRTFQPLDLRGLLAVCAGIPDSETQNAEITGNVDALISAMDFVKKPPVWPHPVLKCGPHQLPINHKKEYNIGYASLAQFEDMRPLLSKIEGNTQDERAKSIALLYPAILSIYLQKIRDREYSYSKAMDMIHEIRTYPAREVVTLGSFFLVKLTNLLNGTPASSPTISPNLKKKKQGSAGYKKRSARSLRSRK